MVLDIQGCQYIGCHLEVGGFKAHGLGCTVRGLGLKKDTWTSRMPIIIVCTPILLRLWVLRRSRHLVGNEKWEPLCHLGIGFGVSSFGLKSLFRSLGLLLESLGCGKELGRMWGLRLHFTGVSCLLLLFSSLFLRSRC